MSEARRYYVVTPLAYTGAASAFTYHGDEAEGLGALKAGQIVRIPIGPRRSLGVVTAMVERPAFATKAVAAALDLPPVPAYLRELAAWLSQYYAASPSAAWTTLLPSGLGTARRASGGRPAASGPGQGLPAAPLTAEQAAALAAIRTSSQRVHLVQGVTGSGKTRLYLELAAEALAAGRGVVVLVPEITLTPQVVAQFEAAFGERVLTTHSKLTPAQRDRIWRAATAAYEAGQPRIVIGPRSSLFLPLHQPGLVVIDECHETSYKQDQHPRYHAITAAAKLSQLTDARVILGSATPGLNELFLAQSGRIGHYLLTQRANKISHSQAQIIDLRNKDLRSLSKFITQPLIDAVSESLAASRQSLLYINRRGSASSQVCGDCGHVIVCPHCQLPLTFHADLMRLICHHCNYRQASPAVCPACHGANLRLLGGGTKRIEDEARRLWPQARIARLDRDSANLKHIEATYRQLRAGELDIIIGTQMIAKGLDLPAIDTVGVVSADTMLHLPDYTAAERTYQLLSQVSGRAGRGDRPGRIFIQTYTPDHPAIVAAANGHYDQLAAAELQQRQALHYPPFVYLLKLTVAAPSRQAACAEAEALATTLQRQPGLTVVGPAPAFIEQQANTFRWVLTVKSNRRPALVAVAQALPGPRWSADLDPINLL
ncbi:MAG TPA: primosomal protein N' [Candidatus Saccharimonadia bacterium]|nr:primosomal protein N' [Candidatus Saccharimonadia bacterium]